MVSAFALLVASLMLVLPTLSSAQAATQAHLIGSWKRLGEQTASFTFLTDGTFTRRLTIGVGRIQAHGRWRLAGDTLVVTDFFLNFGSHLTPSAMGRRVVRVDARRLTMTRVGDVGIGRELRTNVYERADSSPAKP